MDVSYFCPAVLGRDTVAGVILTAEIDGDGGAEYIPYSLAFEPVQEVAERGGLWLIMQMPESFVVFSTHARAERFLAGMWELNAEGLMTPDSIEELARALGGRWCDKSEYGFEMRSKPYLN